MFYLFLFLLFQPLHLDFVWSASILRAQMYGLKPIEDKHMVAKIATNTKVQEFVPKQGLKIAVTDQEAEAMNEGGGETDAGNKCLLYPCFPSFVLFLSFFFILLFVKGFIIHPFNKN